MQIPITRRDARPRRMLRGGWLAAAVGLLLVLGGLAAPEASAQAARKPTPAQKEAELKKVNARIEKVRKSVNEDIEKRDRLSAQLRDAELGVQAARRKLEELRAQRIVSESRLADLANEQAQREKELSAERGALAGELRTAYVNGREEQLKLLLNQQDPASFGRMLAYYGYFGRARAERIDSIRDQLEHLALLREKIAAEGQRIQELEAEQEREVAALKGAQQRRANAVAAVESHIKTRGG
jgi:septal ring factor EnvC (AmiA/AmiB activator)